MNLATVIHTPSTGRAQALILDHFDYSHAVILQNRPIPWDDPMAYSNFVGQGQRLLKPDTVMMHMDRFYKHHVDTNEQLRTDMGARSRTGYALRTLLADSQALDRAWALANTLAQTQSEPVLLQIPSPMRWLLSTHPLSGKDDADELDADDAENASVYVADWLRAFSGVGLAGVLLDDRPGVVADHQFSVGLTAYTPVINVTENYGWSLGIRREDSIEIRGVESVGQVVGSGYWTGDPLPPSSADFTISELPQSAVPEEVIEFVAAFK